MTLREKIGQLIMAGIPGARLDNETRNNILEYRVGNFILFERNVEYRKQVKELCDEIQFVSKKATGILPFIAVDQEGGIVSRFPEDAITIPSAMAIAATNNARHAYTCGEITAKECLSMGINFNLAPVLDINCNPKNPVIGIRSYGDSPKIVSEFGVSMIKGLQEHGVMASAKHFPGHGDTEVDSHLGLPVVHKTWEELKSFEIIPFIEAIDNKVSCITTSHILFPKIELENKPATMSKTILTDLLRKELGYVGLILTDCMEMAAIHDYYGTARGAVEAIKAGATIVCISHTWSLIIEAIKAIEKAVEDGELSIKAIDDAVEKVLRYKELLGESKEETKEETKIKSKEGIAEEIKENHIGKKKNHETVNRQHTKYDEKKELLRKEIWQEQMKQISDEGITKMGDKELPAVDHNTMFIGCPAYRVNLASNEENRKQNLCEYLANHFKGKSFIISTNPSQEEILTYLDKVKDYKTIVYGTYNGSTNEGQITFANKLVDEGHNVIVIALRNPYELQYIKDAAHKIAAFGYGELTIQSLTKVLDKNITCVGKLPVTLK